MADYPVSGTCRTTPVSSGPAESIYSRIKTVKVRAREFRDKQRITNAIHFYLGGLDLYPEGFQKQANHS